MLLECKIISTKVAKNYAKKKPLSWSRASNAYQCSCLGLSPVKLKIVYTLKEPSMCATQDYLTVCMSKVRKYLKVKYSQVKLCSRDMRSLMLSLRPALLLFQIQISSLWFQHTEDETLLLLVSFEERLPNCVLRSVPLSFCLAFLCLLHSLWGCQKEQRVTAIFLVQRMGFGLSLMASRISYNDSSFPSVVRRDVS